MDLFFIPFLFLPFLLMKKGSSGSSSSSNSGTNSFVIPNDIEMVANVPFAIGEPNPIWPVITNNSRKNWVSYKKINGKYNDSKSNPPGNPARSFGWVRDNGRYHAGVDLYGNSGDPVLAMESGTIVGIQGFLGPTKAILVEGDNSGLVILYGEITDESWSKLGLKKGSHVTKGQQIATIGLNNASTSMLHFETYIKGTTKNYQWKQGTTPDPHILNPTKYLLKALKTIK